MTDNICIPKSKTFDIDSRFIMDYKEEQKIAYFVSFCIEQYKHAKGLTGEQAFLELDRYGVLDYLEENYEVLHTQGHRWLLDDIDEFIAVRRKEGVQ